MFFESFGSIETPKETKLEKAQAAQKAAHDAAKKGTIPQGAGNPSLNLARKKTLLPQAKETDKEKTVVVQRYLEKPLLYRGRKFDFRVYTLTVRHFGSTNVYFYRHGYIRTSSYAYDPTVCDRMVHLTNEAVQVKNKDSFGQFESGNKIYYPQIEEYFRNEAKEEWSSCLKRFEANYLRDASEGFASTPSFLTVILPQIQWITASTMDAALENLDPPEAIGFELLGFDYMVDENLRVWLIEVNQNPCLDALTPRQDVFISKLVDDTLR